MSSNRSTPSRPRPLVSNRAKEDLIGGERPHSSLDGGVRDGLRVLLKSEVDTTIPDSNSFLKGTERSPIFPGRGRRSLGTESEGKGVSGGPSDSFYDLKGNYSDKFFIVLLPHLSPDRSTSLNLDVRFD